MIEKSAFNKGYFKKRDSLDPKISSSIVSLAESFNLKKILDVGCGTGKLVRYLRSKGYNAIGCDPYSIQLPKKNFIKAKATELPFSDKNFDLVTCISVIEHLKKKEAIRFLKEAQRVLKDGGYIFLVTPNYNSIWRFIFGKGWYGYSDPTHIKFYTPHSLSMLLKNYGFKRIKFQFASKNLNLVDYLLVATPFWRIRESFYIAGEKK